MKPAPFEYHDPTTIAEATSLLAAHGDECKPLAGGQSLVPMLALRLARFAHLVDVNGVDGLGGIEDLGSSISIGAAVRQRTIERSEVVRQRLPLLAHATGFIGHFQIRTRGTIGGSLAHADAAAEYPAVAVTLDARLVVASAAGERTLSAHDFFQGLWTTALEESELLTRIEFPIPSQIVTDGFAEVARRPGDFATAGAAVQLEWDDDRVVGGRLAMFGVDVCPALRTAEELDLVGATASAADPAAAAAAAVVDIDPISDVHASAAYRRSVAEVVVRRSLDAAIDERRR